PEDHEQRHHRRDEVGVGDLPGAAVVGGVAGLFDSPDDDRLGVVRHQPEPACFTARQASSVSSADGRSSEKTALRANSTATTGAVPRSAATTPSLMQRRYFPFATSCSSELVAIGW